MVLRFVCMGVFFLCASAAVAQTAEPAAEVSDRTLRTLKALAWQSLRGRADESGTVLEIDKSDPAKIVIPDADARKIIREASLTARAHKCDLQDLVIANRDALLLREKQTGRWTAAQLQYINTLHLFTVQLLLGKVDVVDARPGAALPPPMICNEKEKQDISSAVEANERLVGKS